MSWVRARAALEQFSPICILFFSNWRRKDIYSPTEMLWGITVQRQHVALVHWAVPHHGAAHTEDALVLFCSHCSVKLRLHLKWIREQLLTPCWFQIKTKAMLKYQFLLPQVLSISGPIKQDLWGSVLKLGWFSILVNDSACRKDSTQLVERCTHWGRLQMLLKVLSEFRTVLRKWRNILRSSKNLN